MAINKNDLLKLIKANRLIIVSVEDDSSDANEVKILHLQDKVTAVGSIPTAEGHEMRVVTNKVYVGSDNIEELLKDCVEEKDGDNTFLVYNGGMHLDVSKPAGREINGQYAITKPAKVWLTKVKFSRFGGQSRQTAQQNLNTTIAGLFGGGKTLDLTVAPTAVTITGKVDPAVVPNKPVEQ